MSFKITGSGSCIPSVIKENSSFLNNSFMMSAEINLESTTKLLLINLIRLPELIKENMLMQI